MLRAVPARLASRRLVKSINILGDDRRQLCLPPPVLPVSDGLDWASHPETSSCSYRIHKIFRPAHKETVAYDLFREYLYCRR